MILELEQQYKALENKIATIEGKLSLLKEQSNQSFLDIQTLKDLQAVNAKAVELMNIVQKVTKDTIVGIFENVVSKALAYIHQDNNYKFKLEFGRRGAIPELDFSIQTPELEGAHSLIDCHGGGSNDIISLALRTVLVEVSKTPGFIFLDEPDKALDSPEKEQKMIEFVKEFQKNTNRQIFWITHKDIVVESVENPIIIGGQTVLENTDKSPKSEIVEKPKKTRKKKNAE
jgi:DNA repair exonuclease SbcCD ATPase subunit